MILFALRSKLSRMKRVNLIELLKSLCFSREHKSLRGEILSAGKILDIHLQLHTSKYEWVNEVPSDMVKHSEDKMSQNRVSAETLLYSWNIWKDQIISVFDYLQCLETQELVKHIGHGEFCLNYFGVRRQISNLNVIYVLVNPDANWVKRIDERSLEKNGKLVCIDAQQFVPAARCYWQRELFSIGMKILEKLEVLYKWSTKSSMFRQSMCLLQIFEVAKFLTGCQFLDGRQHNSSTLQNFLDWSIKGFVRIVFPLDWRLAVNKDMISLREMDLSRKLLEEAIRKNININLKEDVTYGTVGRVMMIWLGSGRPETYLFEKIISRLKGTWMKFAQDLYPFEISDSKAPLDGNRDTVDASSLIYNYHKALQETYNINRRMFDYISPKCFLYHVDRLLIMASHFRGLILTTKSSFLEWFLHHPSVANSRSGSLNMNISSEAIFDFVVNMVLQSLDNMHDTEVWISGSDTNMKWYYPLLVLKLFVILSLVCLNSRKYHGALFNLLERGDITSLLPREFYIILRRSKGRNRLYLNERIVSEAFKTIGDPLVIASSEKPHSNIVAPEAIFVDIGVPISKEEIMRLMFPSTVQQERNATAAEVGPTNPDAVEDPTSNDDAVKNSNGASMSTQNVDLKIENEALLMDWEVFNEISESLNSARKKGNFVLPNVKSVKGQLEKNMNVLSVAINQENKTNEEDLSVIGDAKSMIDELKKMLSALDMSENKLEDISSILKNLQSRRRNVEKFLKNRSLINAEDTSVKSEEKALDSNRVAIDEIQCHKEDDDGDDGITEGTSDSTAVRETSACETQTKGKKSKANKNPKKGKKGKKK